MRRIWFHLGSLGLLLGLTLGCRTTPPELKPATMVEEYKLPPDIASMNSPNYPKEALARDDFNKKMREGNGILPAKGMGPGGMGMGGTPGGR